MCLNVGGNVFLCKLVNQCVKSIIFYKKCRINWEYKKLKQDDNQCINVKDCCYKNVLFLRDIGQLGFILMKYIELLNFVIEICVIRLFFNLVK